MSTKKRKLNSRNTSGHTGVVWDSRDERWRAECYTDGHKCHLGNFINFNDAVACRKSWEDSQDNQPYTYHTKGKGVSGRRGVYWNKRCKRWEVQGWANGKNIHLGKFNLFADAVAARERWEQKRELESRQITIADLTDEQQFDLSEVIQEVLLQAGHAARQVIVSHLTSINNAAVEVDDDECWNYFHDQVEKYININGPSHDHDRGDSYLEAAIKKMFQANNQPAGEAYENHS